MPLSSPLSSSRSSLSRPLTKQVVLTTALMLSTGVAFAARESPQEKQARYEGYVATYQKLANERLWQFRSTANPAILAIYVDEGLDDLKRVSEYLGQSLEIDAASIRARATSDMASLESSLEDYKAIFTLLYSLQEQGFPGLHLQQRDIDKTSERLLSAKESLNALELEIPLLKSKIK